jgi:hypothetical protein
MIKGKKKRNLKQIRGRWLVARHKRLRKLKQKETGENGK